MSTDIDSPWKLGWEAKLREALRSLGFSSVQDLADANPLATLDSLAEMLNGRFAAAQIYGELVREAEEQGRMRECAAALLLRAVHSIPEGWPATPAAESDETRIALAQWGARLPKRYQGPAARMIDALLTGQLAPPCWAPRSTDDPVVSALFRLHWGAASPEGS